MLKNHENENLCKNGKKCNKVGHTDPKICSGQKTMDGGRRTDIWITKSLPELSSGETKITFKVVA